MYIFIYIYIYIAVSQLFTDLKGDPPRRGTQHSKANMGHAMATIMQGHVHFFMYLQGGPQGPRGPSRAQGRDPSKALGRGPSRALRRGPCRALGRGRSMARGGGRLCVPPPGRINARNECKYQNK